MAIYHLSMSNVSRAKGGSSCASLAYITGEKVTDERTGKTFSYSRRERVAETGTLLPDGAPTKYTDPSKLFNDIEKLETAGNARTAKKIEIALPHELTLEQQKRLVERYIKENLNAHGYAATYAIHNDPDGKNPHTHILIPNRQMKNGKWCAKRKMQYVLDKNGERVPVIEKKLESKKSMRTGASSGNVCL